MATTKRKRTTRSKPKRASRSGTSRSASGSRAKAKSSSRKYGKAAIKKVERALHELKRGTLISGGSGKKVKSRKQAIAIGLAEARRAGAKVPKKKKDTDGASK